MPVRKAKTQVFDPVAYGKAQSIIGQGGPILSKLLGGGPMRRPAEDVSWAGMGTRQTERAAAEKQSAAKSGLVTVHTPTLEPKYTQQGGALTSGSGSAYGTTLRRDDSGGFVIPTGPRGLEDYYSEITGMSGRITGEDYGPSQLLKDFQGSNRGSGGYIAQIPRYSIAETRKTLNKFDKANFLRLNAHVRKKFLEPGTEQMMKRQKNYFGAARRVTRQFL